jgi:hypothetical protein
MPDTRDPVPTPISQPAVAPEPPAVKAEAPKAAPKLAKASEGPPDIQWLIAQRYTHQQNGDADGIAAVTKQLADLGYE